MKITEVNTPKAPKAVGPYVQANKTTFLSANFNP